MNEKVRQLLLRSVGQSELRVSLVVSLLSEGHFEAAVDQALPLIGTPHSPWFLYARSWHYLSLGRAAEADRLLSEAFEAMEEHCEDADWEWTGFTFTETGKPRINAPFNSPLEWAEFGDHVPTEFSHLGFPVAMFTESWLDLLNDISRNIREYKRLFKAVAAQLEKVLHHDGDTISIAIGALELEGAAGDGSQFLMLATLTESHLRMTADTLWRVTADWGDFLPLCEITSFFYYLLDDEATAISLANRGLKCCPESVICGNVRALVLNQSGRPFLADEQWQRTLLSRPENSATYLVLGNQALQVGGLDPALRYFQEALALGDNGPESERFLSAALECL